MPRSSGVYLCPIVALKGLSDHGWIRGILQMTQMVTRRAVLGVLALPLAGCAAEGARYQPDGIARPRGSGTIYVYRPLSPLGVRGEDPFVSMAGKSYGRMRAGSFIAGTFPEGEVDVTVQQSLLLIIPTIPKTVTITVVRGSTSYVRLNQTIDKVGLDGGASVMQSVEIEEVPSEVGQAEIAQARQNI